MVEGDERARSARGSPRGPGPSRERSERADPTGHDEPEGSGAGPGSGEPADSLSALLATLGTHLERHAPADVAILLRAELERREFLAYTQGWRDAADAYEPALEQARRIAQSRRLRLVGRTPGQAAVIPFPQDSSGAAWGVPVPEPDAPVRGAAGAEATDASRADDVPGKPAPSPVVPRRAAQPGSGLVAKNRKSRAPTIPRLAVQRPGRPDPRSQGQRADSGDREEQEGRRPPGRRP
ncbi:hypothetical protein ACFYX5_19870 [Streptomyces rubiginosohelvolus]|uniref:hypothetical protein n=1 Tax=Streptomyces rubiginosohelvolus TaxID=67362 RepID=UPI0036B06125